MKGKDFSALAEAYRMLGQLKNGLDTKGGIRLCETDKVFLRNVDRYVTATRNHLNSEQQ
jgi:hypothetical protein